MISGGRKEKGNKIRRKREGDERTTGTLVDPQTGELASGYTDVNNGTEICKQLKRSGRE